MGDGHSHLQLSSNCSSVLHRKWRVPPPDQEGSRSLRRGYSQLNDEVLQRKRTCKLRNVTAVLTLGLQQHMDGCIQTDRRSYETLAKMSTTLHVVVPCRRRRAHTALVWILECSQVQEHPVLVPDSCLVPRPCTGWTPVCVCVCTVM